VTTLAGRPNTALLVIDVQQDVLAGAASRDSVIANIAGLVNRARAAGSPVVWVQHAGDYLATASPGWQLVPELPPGDGEPLVHKQHSDSFEATDLEQVLAGHGIGRLVVAGAESDACIRATVHGAFVRGYDVTLVSDAHTTNDRTVEAGPLAGQLIPATAIIEHTNMYWSYQTGPGRTAEVVDADQVSFG
jgi:nicotinamidase-related amidase